MKSPRGSRTKFCRFAAHRFCLSRAVNASKIDRTSASTRQQSVFPSLVPGQHRLDKYWCGTMHHLHPRSRMTSTLFTTTLAVSFLVVGLPHLLPCPVDRRQFADSADADGKIRRRRRRSDANVKTAESGDTETSNQETSEGVLGRKERECPVPKPGGRIGQMMGFETKQTEKPIEVVVRQQRSKVGEEAAP